MRNAWQSGAPGHASRLYEFAVLRQRLAVRHWVAKIAVLIQYCYLTCVTSRKAYRPHPGGGGPTRVADLHLRSGPKPAGAMTKPRRLATAGLRIDGRQADVPDAGAAALAHHTQHLTRAHGFDGSSVFGQSATHLLHCARFDLANPFGRHAELVGEFVQRRTA